MDNTINIPQLIKTIAEVVVDTGFDRAISNLSRLLPQHVAIPSL